MTQPHASVSAPRGHVLKDVAFMERLLITAGEAAELLALSRSKIYAMIATGELQSVRIGRSVRVVRASVWHLVEELAA